MNESSFTETVPSQADLLQLYGSVGWAAYTKVPDDLERAVRQSSYVTTAWDGDQLVGLARGVSDDVSIFYLQDILVRPEQQRCGIGRALMTRCLERYAHVRQMVLLTDDQPEQLAFYQGMGFSNTRTLVRYPTNAFYRVRDTELS